jgi:hypothetical protein
MQQVEQEIQRRFVVVVKYDFAMRGIGLNITH